MARKKFREVSPESFYGQDDNEKLSSQLKIRQRSDLTTKQKALLHLIEDDDTKILFLSGPAGSAKSYLGILAGLQLLNKGKVQSITYVRSVIESASRSMGFLKGSTEEKMQPYLNPLHEKLEELLLRNDISELNKDQRIKGTPVNFLRGASIKDSIIIADEAQNFDGKELTTIMTRIGEGSKLIILADPLQSDINGLSKFQAFFNLFNNEESKYNGIFCVAFDKSDIVRSGVIRFILEKIESQISIRTGTRT